jgi:Protein of unknown function (DUF732)
VNAAIAAFLAAVQALGIGGTVPAMLENGYSVCWQVWDGDYTNEKSAAVLQAANPTLTADQALKFVYAAVEDLCPLPGEYDSWTYGNGSPGGGGGAGA